MSASRASMSTILPFPSSPHWAPTTTNAAICYTPDMKKALTPRRARAPARLVYGRIADVVNKSWLP